MTAQPGAATDRGSITVWLMMVPLLLAVLAGISLDLWAGMSTRARIAAIADDAAAIGATAVSAADARGADQQVVLDAVEAERRATAAVDDHPEVRLVTARQATAAPDLITVTVEGRYDFLLLRLVGADSTPIRVSSQAAPSLGG